MSLVRVARWGTRRRWQSVVCNNFGFGVCWYPLLECAHLSNQGAAPCNHIIVVRFSLKSARGC